jgi:hypothetical protein
MKTTLRLGCALIALAVALPAAAAVGADEAAKLKTDLTPLGAERAGNKDDSIPPWTGGLTTPIPGQQPGGRRGDPFKDEKPLFSITAKNMDQYFDRLTDGTQAMLKKYPDTFRVDVYKTHRTAAAPQWVYDNTARNATRAHAEGGRLRGAYGGIPFPIPKTGEEVMWNHVLRWVGEAYHIDGNWYVLQPDGRTVLISDTTTDMQNPYYFNEGSADEFDKGSGTYWQVRNVDIGPPIKVGEALLTHQSTINEKSQTWVYLTGQRRVRMLPNACCDTPTPAAAGLMTLDETYTFAGRNDRFDWKLVGQEGDVHPLQHQQVHAAQDGCRGAGQVPPESGPCEVGAASRLGRGGQCAGRPAPPDAEGPVLLRRGHVDLCAGRPLGCQRPAVAHGLDACVRRARATRRGARHHRLQ